MGVPEQIPSIEVKELILKDVTIAKPRIHPRMLACSRFMLKKRDYQLKTLPEGSIFESDPNSGENNEINCYICKQCGGAIKEMDFRTIKCPRCHTKYTWYESDKGESIRVNVDVHAVKEITIQELSGISEKIEEEEDPKVTLKRMLTEEYWKKIKKRRIKTSFSRKEKLKDRTDYELRHNLLKKYGTEKFFRPRIFAILISCILATFELKVFFSESNRWIVEQYVYGQMEQIRKFYVKLERLKGKKYKSQDLMKEEQLKILQTAERVIANKYWQVCKRILKRHGFNLSNRKLLRYVREFLEQPFRGSKGYSPGNTLINNIHKLGYEWLRRFLYKKGFGFDCPGVAEHTNTKFGLVLDLSDLIKVAFRFELIENIISGKISETDLYSIFGRHGREIYVLESNSFPKLKKLVRSTFQKIIYSVNKSSNTYHYQELTIKDGFEQFMDSLVSSLKYQEQLDSVFIYAPDKEDYQQVTSMLECYDIPIPCVS